GGLSTLEEQVLGRAARGPVRVSPYMLPGTLPNMGAARIAIKFGIHATPRPSARRARPGAVDR
ncbi:beta-ketoacyl synthase, partial [Micromonospora sp. b486]|nr:beta-ketoacyl synthase [Micromonospora sp. WMMB482]MDM4784679.1 beta-ketoacyl synthase [Micromonospora sp. b486]